MNGLLSYSGITAKIRAMDSHRITIPDYEYLSNLYTVNDFFSFLREHKAYSPIFVGLEEENLHRGQIEKYLDNALYHDFSKIYGFCNMQQRVFLDLIFFRYEIDILKSCLSLSFSDSHSYDPPITNEFILKHLSIPVHKLIQVRSSDEFIQLLKGTIYYKLFIPILDSHNSTSFDYELALDHFYYKRVWKLKEKLSRSNQKVFADVIGSEIDMQNLIWLYRQKQFFDFSSSDIYANIIPVNYKLKFSLLKKLGESSTMDEFKNLLNDTPYKDLLDTDHKAIETSLFQYSTKVCEKNVLKHPNSMAPVLLYLHNKKREINRLTTALEGVRYHLESSEIMKYILEG